MDLSFMILGLRPLGLLLDDVMAVLHTYPVLTPRRLTLGTRTFQTFDRELSQVTREISSATVRASLMSGALEIKWAHNDQAHEQILTGRTETDCDGLNQLRAAMTNLCNTVGATYAFLDLTEAAGPDSDQWEMGLPVSPSAFYSLYWYNFFGALYRHEIPDVELLKHFGNVEARGDGTTILVLGQDPQSFPRQMAVKRLTDQWSVFRKYSKCAAFRHELHPDYSEVRNVSPPEGEYHLGATILSENRHNFLTRYGLGPVIRDGEEIFHVIQPRFCRMLGIDPEEMLVIYLREPIARHYRSQIESHFAQIPEEMPLARRVWMAHQSGCQGVSPAIKNYVKERFFAQLFTT